MSSTTRTSGRAEAIVSKRRLKAQAVSSGEPAGLSPLTAPEISRAATSPRSTSESKLAQLGLGILTGELAHDLAQREVGDPVSIRDAAADQDSRAGLERADQLAHEA